MTLIDKAEALLPCPFCGGEARKWQDPSHSAAWFIGCDDGDRDCFGSFHWAETEAEAIEAWNRRALPARGVGVKPLVWQPIVKGARRPVGLVLLYRKSVTAEDKLVAAICKGTPEASDEILLGKWRDGAWRQWNTGWTVNGVTHWMPLPEPPEILAALAPTDAAHVNKTPKSEHDAGNVLTAAQARPAWLSNCVVCGRIVDTRETDEGGDGHGCEYAEGWTCSSDCAERLHPDPDWMKEGLAAQAREAALARSANRVDYNPDGTLDEIVTDAGVHLEHMGGRRWFLGAARSDGTEIRVWFDGKVTLIEDDAKEART